MVRFAAVELLRCEITSWGVNGAVAELGMGVGTFAAMPAATSQTVGYLFDTFAGFDARDLAAEAARAGPACLTLSLPATALMA